ncbi:GGDEF domain-containing protein [Denitromonas sp.]|jgi:diguanylate cyclase (GGDEF)-like protein|uniref:GGDEF domain-containing protein n=1 Tax=Denitromonas sp. TaxID=2734609 RepID=UPI002AFEFB70|nr:GGDEF domain-containing protein [Denitromonas sp.]
MAPTIRPFPLGVSDARPYAVVIFLTRHRPFMRSNSRRRHRRSSVKQQIVALEQALEQAQHLLHQDDLTPLLNRRGFRRACDQWADGDVKDASACCVMVDLDGFKAINDRHGHPVGDAALIHFATTLRRHMRPTDTIARLGGDEFALILSNCSGSDARKMLERLRGALAVTPLPASDSTVFLRFSAGIAERHGDESLAQALERADAALLDAKRQSKATVSLGVPPARSVDGATANACGQQIASACTPTNADSREGD